VRENPQVLGASQVPMRSDHCAKTGSGHTHDKIEKAENTKRCCCGRLDVTDPQPLPADHPLWQMKNVIVTPHASGHSPLRAGRMQDLVVENMRLFLEGGGGTGALRNQVDTAAGY
jgi:phosphoglycerate dehydrogenase-like enzyme